MSQEENKAIQERIAAKRSAGRPKKVFQQAPKDLDLDAAVYVASLDTNVSAAKELNNSKVELSDKEMSDLRKKKKAERKALMRDRDVLALDESLKKPGKRYRLTNLTPGNIEKQRSRGYEICNVNPHKGDGSLSNATTASGSSEVEVGKSHTAKAVWMETDEENYQILRELEDDAAAEQETQLERGSIKDEEGQGFDGLIGGYKKG